jgi:hypothetical protein
MLLVVHAPSRNLVAVMQFYRIFVRLKGGGQATGRELHKGDPPNQGTEVDVPLITGRTVKARIGSFRRHGSARTGVPGSVTNEVYADEI